MRTVLPAIIVGGSIVVLLAFWLGLVLGTGTDAAQPHGVVEYWFFRYQTLFAGTFALIAAAIGAYAVYGQTRQSDQVAKDARMRKARSARAMLPLALSNIIDYAEQCGAAMYSLVGQCHHHTLPSPAPNPPAPIQQPDEALSLVREYIEHADDSAAYALVALVAKFQIQRSRTSEVLQHASGVPARIVPMDLNLTSYLIDAAELYARASALFRHARQGQTIAPITSNSVEGALNNMGLDDHTDAAIYQRVRNRASWELRPD